jgi:hypothetical protein
VTRPDLAAYCAATLERVRHPAALTRAELAWIIFGAVIQARWPMFLTSAPSSPRMSLQLVASPLAVPLGPGEAARRYPNLINRAARR